MDGLEVERPPGRVSLSLSANVNKNVAEPEGRGVGGGGTPACKHPHLCAANTEIPL